MTIYSRWATPEEVEAHLNGEGFEDAVWVQVAGDISEGSAQFDMAVPLSEEYF